MLTKAWENARSVRSEKDLYGMNYIGTITKGNTDFLFYKDRAGDYFYDTKPKGAEKPKWMR